MMKSFFYKARVGAFIALAIFAQSGLAAESHEGGDATALDRYRNKFPKIDTVLKAFTTWSDKENEGEIGKLSPEEHKKQAEWATKVLWLRGKMDASCKDSSDPSSKQMKWMLDYCFGVAGEGQNPAAVYRLVVDGLKSKEDDAAQEIGLAMREVKACREAFADMFKWKANKVKEEKAFSADKEFAEKIDKFLGKLEDKFEATDGDETEGEKKIAEHKEKFQAALKEVKVENMCRLVSDTGGSGARPTPTATPTATPTSTPAASNNAKPVWKDKWGNACTPPAEGCYKQEGNNARPPAYVPQGGAYSAYTPPTSAVIPPSYGGGYGGQCGFMGCGYGGYGGCKGAGYLPPPAPATPGVLPPPPIFPAAPVGGFGFNYASGPKYPPPPPPYPPMPMVPPPMAPPLMFAQTASSSGPDIPTVTKVETVTVAKTTPISTPTPMPMPMGFVNRCGKPVCNPMFGMGALASQFPMVNPFMRGYPPVTGFYPQNNIPPSVTPYYPGTNPGTYGPIVTNPVVTTTPTSPYVNPTFYGTPGSQYQQIPSTRDRIGRIT